MQRIRLLFLFTGFLLLMVPTSVDAAKRPQPFPESISIEELREDYATAVAGGANVRILIVPGHEPTYGGAEFMGFYERELILELARKLEQELGANPNLEVLVSRGALNWNSALSKHFTRQSRSIKQFVATHKKEMVRRVKGAPAVRNQVEHNEANPDVALRLYGITDWANKNRIDLMIHLHLNDETDHASNERGKHSGVAVYVPDALYGNARVSKEIGTSVFHRLNTLFATSTLPIEDQGVVADRDLIALGANNTSKVPSILIEYGYIYEPTFTGSGARSLAVADMAYQTALGVQDFFSNTSSVSVKTRALPHSWSDTTTANDTYALQVALRGLGMYPPRGETFATCPISGVFGPCTETALKAFQASRGLEQTGAVGPRTRAALVGI